MLKRWVMLLRWVVTSIATKRRNDTMVENKIEPKDVK
jgi:hypothetical protein